MDDGRGYKRGNKLYEDGRIEGWMMIGERNEMNKSRKMERLNDG